MVGIALRCGFALGLHVRNEDPLASSHKKELLANIWWSLYSLERTLSIVTGRPSIIVDSTCSVPLPDPTSTDVDPAYADLTYESRRESMSQPGSTKPATIQHVMQPYSGLAQMEPSRASYFHAVVTLSIITQNILTTLYSAGTMIRSPSDLKQDIVQLRHRLEHWTTVLPSEFKSDLSPTRLPGNFSRESTLLAFQVCSANMLLARPYLTERSPSWAEQNEALFAKTMANSGIEAAKSMIALLPENGPFETAYDQGPWWCLTHHVMQAVSTFMLSLCYQPSHFHSNESLFEQAKKGMVFLQRLRDPLSERACQIAFISISSAAKRLNYDVPDLTQLETQGSLSFIPSEDLALAQVNTGIEYMSAPAYDSAPMMLVGAIMPDPYYGTGNNQ